MTTLSFATLRKANIARLPLFKNSRGEPAHSMPDGSDWSLNDWMTAILGELGEAANIVKKIRRGDMSLIAARDTLGDEFADVVIYTDLTAFQMKFEFSSFTHSFVSMRDISDGAFKFLPELSMSDCLSKAAEHLGTWIQLANNKHWKDGDRTLTKTNSFYAFNFINEIDFAARLASIDLGAKVREKFNIVSRRVGAGVFINEDDCAVDHNGNII